MAVQKITHFVNAFVAPFSALTFIAIVFTLAGFTIIPKDFMGPFNPDSTIRLIRTVSRPLQFIGVVHVLRHPAARELNYLTKISLCGFGMQALPVGELFKIGEMMWIYGRVPKIVEDGNVLSSMAWDKRKECFELGLLSVLVFLELGLKRGVPLIGKWIDIFIEEGEQEDMMKKGAQTVLKTDV
jgi:hypothetical protein